MRKISEELSVELKGNIWKSSSSERVRSMSTGELVSFSADVEVDGDVGLSMRLLAAGTPQLLVFCGVLVTITSS
jgi:hypothetical protein